MLKQCNTCHIDKELSEYHKGSDKYGKKYKCISCCSLQYQINKEKLLSYQKERYKNKSESLKEYQKKWRKDNLGLKAADSAKRRCSLQNATPSWLDNEQKKKIKEIYLLANKLTVETGEQYNVDHIVPLNHPLVCGLHVDWNLQVISANENIKKSNTFHVQ